jgi:hypothetical protein
MKRNITAGLILTASLISVASAQVGYSPSQISNAAQDWYHNNPTKLVNTPSVPPQALCPFIPFICRIIYQSR